VSDGSGLFALSDVHERSTKYGQPSLP
jgi:hypothetical protein